MENLKDYKILNISKLLMQKTGSLCVCPMVELMKPAALLCGTKQEVCLVLLVQTEKVKTQQIHIWKSFCTT